MPIAPFEKTILRLLAANRNLESFVAGAMVLLRADDSHRRSQDIDLFHDTAESIKAAAEADGATLEKHGYTVTWQFVEPTFRRALVTRDGSTTKLEWVFDSAFPFFPVEADTELGYVVACKKQWLEMTREAFALFDRLPAGELGCLYLDVQNSSVTPDPASPEFPKLRRRFGSVRGAWPVVRG